MSRQLRPHLSVIDGFEGMEGNGPNDGTPVDHRVCIARLDWLSTDHVGIELMGIDFANVGYMNFCSQTGSGTSDLREDLKKRSSNLNPNRPCHSGLQRGISCDFFSNSRYS